MPNPADESTSISQIERRQIGIEAEIRHLQGMLSIWKGIVLGSIFLVIAIVGSAFTIFGLETWPNWKTELRDDVKADFNEIAKKYGPRELGRSAASAEIHYALTDYMHDFHIKHKVSGRRNNYFKIDQNLDPKRFSYEQVRRNIVDNQASLIGVMPLIINDVRTHFAEDGHVVFWIISKALGNMTGSARAEFVELLRRPPEGENIPGSSSIFKLFEVVCDNIDKEHIDDIDRAVSQIIEGDDANGDQFIPTDEFEMRFFREELISAQLMRADDSEEKTIEQESHKANQNRNDVVNEILFKPCSNRKSSLDELKN